MTLLDEYKEYLRIDGDEQDLTLSTFLSSAKNALEHAGVKMPSDIMELTVEGQKKFPLHFLALITLAAHYYENRIVSSNLAQNIVPFSVQHMILQLKLVDPNEP